MNNMKDKRLRGKKDMKWYVYHDCSFVKMYILNPEFYKSIESFSYISNPTNIYHRNTFHTAIAARDMIPLMDLGKVS